MTKRIPALAVALAMLAASLAAGCGSGSSSSGSTAAGSTSMQPQTGAVTVKTTSDDLGTILVDGQGRTIYLFQRDSGSTSTCSGACIAGWPAVATHGKPQAAGGVTAGKLGVTKRSDGTTQVTYAGHPLYYYAGDSAAGDTNGQALNAFGAPWYVVGTSGSAITTRATGGGSARGSY